MSDVALAIRLTADADNAVRALDDVGDHAERMAADVDDATRKADAAAGRFDNVAESAGGMASSSSQAAGGLGDLGGALGLLPGPLGALGSGMEAAAPAIMGVTGASDLLELAMNSNAITTARSTVANIAHGVASKAQAAATYVMAGAQRVLNLAMNASPVLLIVTGILALVAAVVLAYKRSETFRRIVQGVFRAVKAYVETYIEVIKRVVGFFTTTLPNAARAVGAKIADVWQAAKDKTAAAFEAIRDKVANVIGAIKDKIDSVRDVVTRVGNGVRNGLGAAFDAVRNAIQPVIDAVQWILDKIASIHIPDIPGVPFFRTAPGTSVEGTGTSSGTVEVTNELNLTLEPGAITGVLTTPDAGTALATILDQWLRSRGQTPLFGTS